MKTLTTGLLVSAMLMLSCFSAIGADFTFMVPYDFKNLMEAPRIECMVSNYPLSDSGSSTPQHHGRAESVITIDAQGNAKGTAQLAVTATGIAPQYIRSYLCRLHFGTSGYNDIGPAPSTPPTYQSQLNHKYKPGTTLVKSYSGSISQ